MYLWKYWRESRITFAVGLLLVGLLLWDVLKIHVSALHRLPGDVSQQNLAQLYLVIAAPLTFLLGFLGLRFGSFGVGRDLGEGSGWFLFSRPRTRAFFVWSDWGFGMTQLLRSSSRPTLCSHGRFTASHRTPPSSSCPANPSPCWRSSVCTAPPACCWPG
jgi:hypothetical protein